jgi:hypothetical protein
MMKNDMMKDFSRKFKGDLESKYKKGGLISMMPQ